MTSKQTLLVTGATGHMAAMLLPALEEKFAIRTVTEDLSVSDHQSLAPLFEGVDSVLHLAYHKSSPTHVYDPTVPQIEKFDDEFLNIRMAQNIYRCSFDAGIKRIVVASSNHATDWYENALIHTNKRDMVTPEETPLADNFYGWSKIAYESLGFVYACGSLGRSMEVVHVRIGAPREIDAAAYSADEPAAPQLGPAFQTGLTRYKRDLGAWLSKRDAQQLFLRSLTVENINDQYGVPFLIVYGISNNTRAFWSLINAREILGYEPQDDSEVQYATDIQRLLTGPTAHVRGGRVGA